MKDYLNTKNHHKHLSLILLLTLASCDNVADFSSSEYLGKSDAKYMSAEVHGAYLQCYPLEQSVKEVCLSALAQKYISAKRKTDAKYIQAFELEAEKFGFKRFLNTHNLPCEEVDSGPIFDANARAYIVTCKPVKQYHMQFNYSTKEWILQ